MNKYPISIILFVSKFVINNDLIEEHPLNIELIEITDEVSKFATFKLIKEEQSLNIYSILTTFIVFKFDKSKFCNE